MLKPTFYAFFIFLILINISCSVPKKDCFLKYSPLIFYVGFDSSDIKQMTVEKYSKCCNYDSLINIDTLYYSDQFQDTMSFGGIYFPSSPSSYADPHFNWILKLPNHVQIKLSNILLNNNTCRTEKLNTPCFCNLIYFDIATENCTYKTVEFGNSSIVYIHK